MEEAGTFKPYLVKLAREFSIKTAIIIATIVDMVQYLTCITILFNRILQRTIFVYRIAPNLSL